MEEKCHWIYSNSACFLVILFRFPSLNLSFLPPPFLSQKDVYLRGDPSNEARVQRLNIDIEHLDMGTALIG